MGDSPGNSFSDACNNSFDGSCTSGYNRRRSSGNSSQLDTSSSGSFPKMTSELDEVFDAEQSDAAAITTVDIPDGRLEEEEREEGEETRTRTVLRLEPVQAGEPSSFRIQFSSSHYAFSLKRSSTIRTISSFYTLAGILKTQHPYVSVPSLPVRPLIYLQGTRAQANQLASWLTGVLTDRQLLSNRSLHLFLQTSYSMERILENAEGYRDDQVSRKQYSSSSVESPGFKTIFGSSYRGSRNMLEDHH